MITMAIGLAAGFFYWLAWYKLAFWILIYAIIYGGLDVTVHLRVDDRRAHSGRLAYRRISRLLVTASVRRL